MSWFESAKELLKRWKVEELTGDSIISLTPRAQQVLALAHKEAERLHHNYIGTEHILLGLIALGQGVAVNVLGQSGLDLKKVRAEVEKYAGSCDPEKFTDQTPPTPGVKKVLVYAREEARALNHTYTGTEHLLLGLLREDDSLAAKVLKNFNVDLEQLRTGILKELDPNFIPEQHPNFVPGEEAREDWFKSAEELLKPRKAEKVSFTPRAQQVLILARKEADRLHHNFLGTEHLLVGLIELGGGVATNVLINRGMHLENVRAKVETLARGHDEKMFGNIPYTPRMRRVLEMARDEAKTLNHKYIGTEHLLLGLLREKEGPSAEIFKHFKLDTEELRRAILKELDPNFPSGDDSKKS